MAQGRDKLAPAINPLRIDAEGIGHLFDIAKERNGVLGFDAVLHWLLHFCLKGVLTIAVY